MTRSISIFVVGCDSLDEEGGYSYAFDPSGELLFSNRNSRGALLEMCELDLSALRASRVLHDNLRDAVLLRRGRQFSR